MLWLIFFFLTHTPLFTVNETHAQGILTNNPDATATSYFSIILDGTNGQPGHVAAAVCATGSCPSRYSKYRIDDGEWHHIAVSVSKELC